jgi:hypothetical protein
MLDHIPYCEPVIDRVTMRVKPKPVAMLSSLVVNIMKPEYCNLISLFVKAFHVVQGRFKYGFYV